MKAKNKQNEHYEHVETIKITVEIEIGYSTAKAREDAVAAAKRLIDGQSCGGAGRNGRYNAVIIGKPEVA
jgi:hypothetical protein